MRWTATRAQTTGNEDIHTPAMPYCQKLTCWCHTDVAYHRAVMCHQASEAEIAHAYHFLELHGCGWPAPFTGLAMGTPEERICA